MTSPKPTPSFLSDTLSTAMGASLWARTTGSVAERHNGETILVSVHLVDMEDDEKPYTVDLDTMRRGLRRTLNGKAGLSADRWKDIAWAAFSSTLPDRGDHAGLDDELADLVLQAGLFGEVKYC